MASRKRQSYNKNWHDYQESNQYATDLAQNQKISFMTTKDNYYIFTKACDENGVLIDLNEHLWEYSINGELSTSLNTTTNIEEKKYLRIEVIKDLITFINDGTDPKTGYPYEIPVDITIN